MGCLKLNHTYNTDLKISWINKCVRSNKSENKVRNNYLFGFNGIEKTNEISGEGNHYTALFGEYDSRLGRRWNQDPKPVVSISNYAMFANNPIWFSDPQLDSSVWDNKGNKVFYDENDKDKRAFMQDGKNLTLLGELGKKINANTILCKCFKSQCKRSKRNL
jgi:hypothetical protein